MVEHSRNNGEKGALEKAIEARWVAHDREHAALALALQEARREIDRRLEAMNELRDQITSERGTFMTREMGERISGELGNRLSEVYSRVDRLETKISTSIYVAVFLVPIVFFVINYFTAKVL
jgi:hypothetical protein